MRTCPACGFDRCDDLAPRCRQCGADMPKPKEDRGHRSLAPAWFHYLQVPEVGTVALTPGQVLCIGRGERCDLRLTLLRSERLASIFWTEDQSEATVERHPEADPKEPVEVNDARLHGVRALKGTEELKFGHVRMTYLKRKRPILDAVQRRRGRVGRDPSRAVVRGDTGLLEPRSRRIGPAPGTAPAANKPATLMDLALQLERKRATGVLKVTSPRGRGWIEVTAGAPTRAQWRQLRGEPAVAAILQQQRLSCEFEVGRGAPQGGGAVQVSFSTVREKIERHQTARATGKLRAQARPKAAAPPKPPTPSWGDRAR